VKALRGGLFNKKKWTFFLSFLFFIDSRTESGCADFVLEISIVIFVVVLGL
jgi:hypothetical protein